MPVMAVRVRPAAPTLAKVVVACLAWVSGANEGFSGVSVGVVGKGFVVDVLEPGSSAA